jgi:hypothetical protein
MSSFQQRLNLVNLILFKLYQTPILKKPIQISQVRWLDYELDLSAFDPNHKVGNILHLYPINYILILIYFSEDYS